MRELRSLEADAHKKVLAMTANEDRELTGWIKISPTVDSGADEHVIPVGSFEGVKLQESEGSKAGRRYVTANGQNVPNTGEKVVPMMTNEGLPLRVAWQVTDVVKPLLSVSKLEERGHIVIMGGGRPQTASKGSRDEVEEAKWHL